MYTGKEKDNEVDINTESMSKAQQIYFQEYFQQDKAIADVFNIPNDESASMVGGNW